MQMLFIVTLGRQTETGEAKLGPKLWEMNPFSQQPETRERSRMSKNQQQVAAREEARKIAGVIVTHGHLAGELLSAAEMIIGPISYITAVSIGWHDDVDAARDEVQRAMTRVSQGAGVLLLTDMFGGTPTNIASMFLEEGRVEVVTGVNLPMVIKLAGQSGRESLSEIARRVCELGRQGIYLAGDLLVPPAKSAGG
jgi:PTS system mannose-specific IIA component